MKALTNYKYLIFDVDDTLLNFYTAFKKSQEDMAKKLGVEYSDEYKKLDEKCGWRAWEESGLEDTKSPDVQENYHSYYFQYIKKHYMYLAQELGIEIDADELTDCYIESISSSRKLMEPETLGVYKALSKKYKLVLATNGIATIQKPRISDFIPFTYKTYISEEVGHIKPSKEFFDAMMQDLGCEANDCLMIGDSLTNDIIGAKEAGMDVCYYNRKKRSSEGGIHIDYEINSISELSEIL